MAYNDSSYFQGQGSIFLQRRAFNGAALGPMYAVGDADKFEVGVKQTFDEVRESQSGLRNIAARPVTATEMNLKLNLLQFNKANLVSALWGTDTGAVSAGSVTSEVITSYGSGLSPLANPGVSSVVLKTYAGTGATGTAGAIASIAVTAGGSGYAANTQFALTLSGAPGTGATAVAYSNAAGVIVGAVVTAVGSGYVAPTASVTTPGGGTGATFQVNLNGASMTLNTDYTLDATNGSYTILPGSLLVPTGAVVNGYTPADGSYNKTLVLAAYSYAAYTGDVELFTTGIQYYTVRLQGFNVINSQPSIFTGYQLQLDMTKMVSLIEAKHANLELDGIFLQDQTKPLPSTTAPFSQFAKIIKG